MDRRQQFIETEQEIYGKFRKATQEVRKNGTVQDKAIAQKFGGIGVVARHPALMNGFRLITGRIKTLYGPCIVYNGANEHSGIYISDGPNFKYNPTQHKETIEALHVAVNDVLTRVTPSQRKECTVVYGRPLYNRSTVIIPGQPSPAYVDLLLAISDACHQAVPQGHASWGSHITVARFLRPQSPEETKLLCDYLEKGAPALGECYLSLIDICSFHVTNEGFELSSHRNLSF